MHLIHETTRTVLHGCTLLVSEHMGIYGQVGGTLAKSSGAFFLIWTLIALGVTALFSVILSARALWEHLSRRTDVQHKQGASA